jgi:hypothetical protein
MTTAETITIAGELTGGGTIAVQIGLFTELLDALGSKCSISTAVAPLIRSWWPIPTTRIRRHCKCPARAA